MSQTRTAMLRLESFAGGLNDTDPPHRIQDTQLAVATDVELTQSGGIVRRAGVARAMGPPTTGIFPHLFVRHTPSQSLTATEVWAFPINTSTFYRSTTGTTWGTVSVADPVVNANFVITDAVSFNGKLYVAYENTGGVDRLHVWDGTSLRRVGISTPVAPTAGNTGAGAYAATVRYYKVQFATTVVTATGTQVTFSDLSDALTFTPSGTGTAARITKPATPDGATTWRVWASADDVSYYLIADQVVATTTFDDSTLPSAYSSVVASYIVAPEAGTYTPPWSAKFLLVDDNRLLIAGAFETMKYTSRVGWSSILGTASAASGEPYTITDDERFEPDNFLDLDSDEGGELTGMELLNGSVYVFKRHAIYKLVRTGDTTAAYKPVTISKVVGAMSRKCIVPGEDERGGPCLYFLSERGPYRFGSAGLQYLGGDIETTWAGVQKRNVFIGPHGVYDARRGQVRWFVTVSQQYPDTQLVFHVRLGVPSESGRVVGGWTKTTTAKPMSVGASALLPNDLTNRDSELAPYAIHWNGASSYPPVVWKYTTTQVSDDVVDAAGAVTGTESITPVATTKTFSLGMGDNAGVVDTYVACTPSSGGTTLSATLSRNFGASTAVATKAFTGTTARIPQQISDLVMSNAQYVSLSLTSSTQQPFVVDEIALRVRKEEPL